MSLFKFAKPKTPGFGISGNFYITVLAAKAPIPSILEVLNPKGEGGAVEGFGAPLAKDATKEDLGRPMGRGLYAIAGKDRKTVLQMMVLSKEEAGFDPEAIVRSRLAEDLEPETLARIRGTWTLLQLRFESHDAMVYPALDFLAAIAKRLAEITDGVIADAIAERYVLPTETPPPPVDPPIRAMDHVAIRIEPSSAPAVGPVQPIQRVQPVQQVEPLSLYAFTLGMRKFALPEIELAGIEPSLREVATAFLLGVCQARLMGDPMKPGDKLGAKSAAFDVAEGGLDRGRWEGIAVLELLPPRGRSVNEALREWAAEASSM